MTQPILIKRSNVVGKVPAALATPAPSGGLAPGEIAISTADGALYLGTTPGGTGASTVKAMPSTITAAAPLSISAGSTGSYGLSLAASGAIAGTYNSLSVDTYGRVLSGTLLPYLSGLTATGDATGIASGSSIALTLAAVGTPGTYPKVTTDAKGRVTAGTTLTLGDVTTGLGYTPLATSGGTISGSLVISGVTTCTAAVTAPTVAATDNSTNVATTAFVANKGEAFAAGGYTYTASVALTAANAGALISMQPTAAATVILPLAASMPLGGTINIQNVSNYVVTVTNSGSDLTDDTATLATTDFVSYTPGNSTTWHVVSRNIVHNGGIAIPGTCNILGAGYAPTVAASTNNNQIATTGMVQAVAVGRVPPGWRNALVNGGFTVNQRAIASGQTVGGGAFFCDRWRYSNVNGGTRSYGVIAATDAVRAAMSDEAVTTIATATFAGTTAAGDCELIYQNTEDPRRLAGKTVIVSGWAYNPGTAAISFAVELTQNFGTGGTPSAEVDSTGCTKFTVPATSWYRFATGPVTIPTLQGKVLGTNGDAIMQLILWLSAGSTFSTPRASGLGVQSGTLQFSSLQIEQVLPGVTLPTQFEYRPPEAELLLCRRFFQAAKQYSATGYSSAGSQSVALSVPYAPTMRATPTIAASAVTNANLGTMAASVLPGDVVFFSGLSTAAGATSFNETFTLAADL